MSLQAQLSVFESFAGRSAMLGFAVATLLELATQHALFPPVTTISMQSLGPEAAATVAAIALVCAAVFKPHTIGVHLQDAVLSSLTAAHRSAASVTETGNLDEALDAVLSRTFNNGWEISIASLDAAFTVSESDSDEL